MSISSKLYTITEYGALVRGNAGSQGYQALPVKAFDSLEAFILANNTGSDTGNADLLSLSVRRGVGKIISAKNFVGIITTNDGTTIEILPKIGDDIGFTETRKVFLDMLRTLKNIPFREFNLSHLNSDRMSLLEIFIRMFVGEAQVLVKQGLKSNYCVACSNERFYKGKLLISENIKHNLINRARFFLAYDEFSINRPENRLIKSTLRYLYNQSRDESNRRAIMLLLPFFDDVEYSNNIEADLSKCINDRSMSHYRIVLNWCKVFLLGNSFTAFAGSEVAIALLFPMEKVFESYVSSRIRKVLSDSSIEVRAQDSRYSLFDKPNKAFALRPDIVISDGASTVVMDTKWKMLRNDAKNSGISQADMYQMYAYSRKYGASTVKLIYPLVSDVSRIINEYMSEKDGVRVKIEFIDLMNPVQDFVRLSKLN